MFSTLLNTYRRNLSEMDHSRDKCTSCLCRLVAGAKVINMLLCTAIGYVKSGINHYTSNVEHCYDGSRVLSYRNSCGNKFRMILRDTTRKPGIDTYYHCLGFANVLDTDGANHETKCNLCIDITDRVHIYGGPRWDFHGTYVTPKELGFDHIFIEDLLTCEMKLILSNDKISS